MLDNNSIDMKTEVQTYLGEETVALIYDNDQLDRWNSLVDELGLKGQTKIAVPTKSPVPFQHLKKSMANVIECLCPRKVSVEDYDITPIPVEILDLIALSTKEEYFHKIQIWYDDKSPDPACVGVRYDTWYSHKDDGGLDKSFTTKAEAQADMDTKGYTKKQPYPTSETYYLMGRWGDVKYSFEELKEMATKRYIAEEGNDLNKKIKEAQRDLADIETKAFDRFN